MAAATAAGYGYCYNCIQSPWPISNIVLYVFTVAALKVEELYHWDHSSNRKNKQEKDDTFKIVEDDKRDVLVMFLQSRADSKLLYNQFMDGIYKPLQEFFNEEAVSHHACALGRVLRHWEALLSPDLYVILLYLWTQSGLL